MMRTASALRAAKISTQRINRTLETFRSSLPAGAVANKRSLTALGNQIAVREGKLLWESDTGQYVLALDIGDTKGGLHVITQPLAPAVTGNAADQHFDKAYALEDSDPLAATAAYVECLAADARHTEARINLGRLLHLAGKLADAEGVYRAAQEPDPLLTFNMGVVLEDLERESEAIAAYHAALVLDPSLADAHFNLARLYERARDAKASFRHMLAYRRMMDRQGC